MRRPERRPERDGLWNPEPPPRPERRRSITFPDQRSMGHILNELGKGQDILGEIFRKAENRIRDPAKLRRLINLIDEEVWMGPPIDVKAEIYEGLLQKNAEDIKSGAGQYFTLRPLIKAMVECISPEPMQTVMDPACGTGGFFIHFHA